MFAGKEVRVLLKGQAKESFIALKKRDDNESQSIRSKKNHLPTL